MPRAAIVTRGNSLLVVAQLPPPVQAWADALRREHYPPDRNRLAAHITLFHGLPPSAADEIHRRLAACTTRTPPLPARFSGLMDLGDGTAIALDCPRLHTLHAELAEQLSGVIQQRDDRPLRPHVTIQAKVGVQEARALQRALADLALPLPFRLHGLATHRWTGDLWAFEREWPFRGQR